MGGGLLPAAAGVVPYVPTQRSPVRWALGGLVRKLMPELVPTWYYETVARHGATVVNPLGSPKSGPTRRGHLGTAADAAHEATASQLLRIERLRVIAWPLFEMRRVDVWVRFPRVDHTNVCITFRPPDQ